jgi:hypothetical protein
MNAAVKRALVPSPTHFGLNLDLGEKVEHISFTDIPMNRAMIALEERYGDDTDKFFSVTGRMWALFHIMHDPAMTEYM